MGQMIKSILVSIIVGSLFANALSDEPTISNNLELRIRAARTAPSQNFLDYQRMEMNAFIHLSTANFTGKLLYGDGTDDPSVFNPTKLDTDQWARIIKEGGMKMMVLTVKHHDGFCLWPSEFTDYSVKSSRWKNGKGDVVKMASDSARKYGLKFGIYYSPADGHERTFGTPQYFDYMDNQLTELLTKYGEITQVWFDGALLGPFAAKAPPGWNFFQIERWTKLVRKLQPNAIITPVDTTLVGDEKGTAPDTWFNVKQNGIDFSWNVMEAVTSMRDLPLPIKYSTFWFPSKLSFLFIRSPKRIMKLYFTSVGKGANLLLNFLPGKDGLIYKKDEKNFLEFARMHKEIFGNNLLKGGKVSSSSFKGIHIPFNVLDDDLDTYWTTTDGVEKASITIELSEAKVFNIIMLKEHIKVGQRIESFSVEAYNAHRWKTIGYGTTIGNKRLIKTRRRRAHKIRINITGSRIAPTLEEVGLYLGKGI